MRARRWQARKLLRRTDMDTDGTHQVVSLYFLRPGRSRRGRADAFECSHANVDFRDAVVVPELQIADVSLVAGRDDAQDAGDGGGEQSDTGALNGNRVSVGVDGGHSESSLGRARAPNHDAAQATSSNYYPDHD